MKLYTLEEVLRAIQACDEEPDLFALYCSFVEKTEYFNKTEQKEMQDAYNKRLNQIQDNDVQY